MSCLSPGHFAVWLWDWLIFWFIFILFGYAQCFICVRAVPRYYMLYANILRYRVPSGYADSAAVFVSFFAFPGGSRAALDFLEFMRILFLPRTCARLRVCPRNLGLVRSGLGGPRGFFFFLIMHFSPSFFEKCATCRLVFQSSGQTRSRGP